MYVLVIINSMCHIMLSESIAMVSLFIYTYIVYRAIIKTVSHEKFFYFDTVNYTWFSTTSQQHLGIACHVTN